MSELTISDRRNRRSPMVPLVLTLAGTALGVDGCSSGTTQQESDSRSSSYNAVSDPAWPKPNPDALPPVNCEWGAPITHQQMKVVTAGGKQVLATLVDTRCEPPFDRPTAGVYQEPTFRSSVEGIVTNGQTVAVDCVTPAGENVGDSRTPLQNPVWVGITFADPGGGVHSGNISVANLGQIDPTTATLPKC